MAGKGRPSLYEKKVEPFLADVSEMALTMTEVQISQTLGIAYSTFREYKKQYPALNEALKNGRADLVKELKSVLIQKAKGFDYQEKKIIKEYVPDTNVLTVVREEIYIKHAVPDVAALNLLLKNYDADNWSNDPQMLKIRKEEIEIQKKKLEDSSW